MLNFEFIRFIIHFNDDKVLSFNRKGNVYFYDDRIEVKIEISPSIFEKTFICKSDIRYFELIEEFEY